MQEVVLPSLWPRKRNTRGGSFGGEEEEGGLKEEGEERVGGGRDSAGRGGDEGLRWRSGSRSRARGEAGFEMPGAMPGMMVT